MPDTMTPDEIREAQQQLGLSDIEFAQMLGFAFAAHVRRLKVRDTAAPSHRPADARTVRLIRAYLEGYRPKDWPG